MSPGSLLRIAIDKAIDKAKETDPEETPDTPDALEQAMSDFQDATTPSEKAKIFRAALELAK